jgi:UDPglucose 6-dehydrogenase
MKIGFIGLGKLGLECAEVIVGTHYYKDSTVNISVTGYDVVKKISDKITITTDIKNAVIDNDFVFIAVSTPHDPKYDGSIPTSHLENKDFDYSYVEDVLHKIKNYITKDQNIVLISTVLPGTCRERFIPIIENTKCNFIYNPYLIAMGTTAWDMLNPEMVIIGNADGTQDFDSPTGKLIQFYKIIMQKQNARIEVGTWDEAECIKIFYNTFISAKIGLVNMIQDVAERNDNIDCDVVANAIANSTQRIMSPAYMKPGMGDGGPCHPRDNIALRYLAEKLDLGYDLFDAIMIAREVQAKRLAEKLISYNLPVVILGKAFKSNVDFIDGSYSMLVGHYVKELAPQLGLYYDTSPPMYIPCIYLLGHIGKYYDFKFNQNSIVVDPWREFETDNMNIKEIIHYGNTR